MHVNPAGPGEGGSRLGGGEIQAAAGRNREGHGGELGRDLTQDISAAGRDPGPEIGRILCPVSHNGGTEVIDDRIQRGVGERGLAEVPQVPGKEAAVLCQIEHRSETVGARTKDV